jgi:integrase
MTGCGRWHDHGRGCVMSPLRQIAEDYLKTRRALGFSLENHGQLVLSFIDHLEQANAACVTTGLAVAWATQTRPGASPAGCSRRLAAVRVFARYLSAVDPRTEVPPADLMPYRYRRVTPYLYRPEEIDALIHAAAALRHPLRALNYATLIALLAATGMRAGEACHLDRGDIDYDTGVLTVRAGKLGKARGAAAPHHQPGPARLRAATRPVVSPRGHVGVVRQHLWPAAERPPRPRGVRRAPRRGPLRGHH